MSREILKTVVAAAENCGLEICACVCDMGGKNRRLWKELGVSEENIAIPHPDRSESKIFFFADIPHVLKLYRNHILDSGIQCFGYVLDKQLIEKLLLRDTSELKICHRLSLKHMDVRKSERQNVRLAAQLLSATTAAAIEYFFPIKKKSRLTSKWLTMLSVF